MKDHLKDLRQELTLESAKKRLGIFWEFKQFAMRGNAVDLAVGVVIGAAFGKIVTSMVADLITPVVGLLTAGGDADLKNKYWPLTEAARHKATLAEAQKAGPVLMWGDFLSSIVDFVIVAFCIFLVVKLMNRMSLASAAVAPPPGPTPTEQLLTEIRDELKKKSPTVAP